MEPDRSILKEFLEGGWLIPLIGSAAMLARLLSSSQKMSAAEYIKKIFSAAIAAGIAWFILEQTDIPSLYKAITYGVIGVVSPEIINGIVKLGKKFQSNPHKYIKKP
jgi:hypothetical protein